MRSHRRQESIVLLMALLLVLAISVMVVGASMKMLPDAPLFPTPTQPKAIDFPDSRPVPAH